MTDKASNVEHQLRERLKCSYVHSEDDFIEALCQRVVDLEDLVNKADKLLKPVKEVATEALRDGSTVEEKDVATKICEDIVAWQAAKTALEML